MSKPLILTLAASATLVSCRTGGGPTPESVVLEAGYDTPSVCSPKRRIDDAQEGIDFTARELSRRDAYWMALLSADAYARKDVAVAELKRLGFDDALFFDEDGVTRNFLNTGLDFPWASTQGFWAEAKNGIVISFRGSFPNELADVVSDVWSEQGKLETIGSQVIGTVTEAAIASSVSLPGGSKAIEAGSPILVHKGFWNALAIVWKHLETKALARYAAERPAERQLKMGLLDAWARILKEKGEGAVKTALEAETDWRIDPAAKLRFLKQWVLQDGEKKRLDLFEFLDANWASKQTPIFLTGHSLGGGLATLAAYRLMQLGLNVRGLYTYGAPRVGNQAFAHEFRVLAFQRGLKGKGTSHVKGNGGLQRFVNHLDVIARVPPAFGWAASFSTDEEAEDASIWAHASPMNYLTGPEAAAPELWLEADDAFRSRFAQAGVPRFVVTLPLERWKEWGSDHATPRYIAKLEQLAFATKSCP